MPAALPPHATPAEVDQSALPQVPPLPCDATMSGNAHAAAYSAERVLPALPCFSATAASAAASRFTPSTTDIYQSCPLSLRGNVEGARTLFEPGQGNRDQVIPISVPPTAHSGPIPGYDISIDAAQKIANDIGAIAQSIDETRSDLDILRNGVSDVAAEFDNKVDQLCTRFHAEIERLTQEYYRTYDRFQDRSAADQETLHDRFEQLKSILNDKIREFDERIFNLNESRADSIFHKLQRTISEIHRFPESLQQLQLGVSNCEARIGFSILRDSCEFLMLESPCAMIFAATPSRADGVQFYDISDGDRETSSLPRLNDPAMQKINYSCDDGLFYEPGVDDEKALFELDAGRETCEADIEQARIAHERAASSHGGGVDYWEYKADEHKWIYHVVVPRKAMVHPPGSIGAAPNPWKLSTVRISKVQYAGKTPVTIREESYAFGKTRLMQSWTGTVEFFDDGYAPRKAKAPSYSGSISLGGKDGLGYEQSAMSRDAELRAMGRNDDRDAVPADVDYDSGYESPACRTEHDYWHHDSVAGTVTRFHVVERRARFDPQSVKGCPIDPSLLSDARITCAMTGGTEFTLQDSWRSKDSRTLPCRWTGKTVVVIGNPAKSKVKVSFDKMKAPDGLATARTKSGFNGHALQANARINVPARGRAKIPTGSRFTSTEGMTARVQPAQGSVCDVCPAMYTYGEGTTHADVEVFNPTNHDVTIQSGETVAVAQFYTSTIAHIEFESDEEPLDAAPSVSDRTEAIRVSTNHTAAPAMPQRDAGYDHRAPESSVFFYSACVARPVDRKERAANPKAKAALDKEGETAHVGRIFDICVEKNSELPETDPNRKFKGRVVFEGCHVKDEGNNWAIFSEITSCPATMEAGKAADAFGLLPGHEIQVADGESAYTQAKLGGPATWVRLPKERWPPEWQGKYHDPVVRLVLALYGHPDAGDSGSAIASRLSSPLGLSNAPIGRASSGIPSSTLCSLFM
ncbi:unnamed protein product [Symbiodinium sp. CCMP2456]|nr:unnamed protein product [Symbiodinium sp. CCMP2456]